MNGLENRKGQDLQKPFPGCMGRMINIFDLSTGMPRTKLLTEKSHRDASSIRRSQPDAVKKKVMENFGILKEDITITSNMRKNPSRRSSGTPMKMLIAQEMSSDSQSKQMPSNVVAKLMGLDTMPVHQSVLNAKTSSEEAYSHKTLSGEFRGYRQQENSSYDNSRFDSKSCSHDNKYKDICEVWHQPSRNNYRRHNEPFVDSIDKRMALVHQKFIEAKRLATDEKLLQSKEFQDAIEVLSSNRDLFLKFLEEPNALFSKNLSEHQTNPPAPQTRHITVLKPPKPMEPKAEALDRKHCVHHKIENTSQPTRIVVLKPSLSMPNELKTGGAPPITSSKLPEARDCYGCLGPDEETDSREIAREITRKMLKYASSIQKDEILLSSALSNGYFGDESSFNISENDSTMEEYGCASDSDSVTPRSRHSCDYSISSFSRASHSSEPSVIKEAKKRLSERLAMVASIGVIQGQSQVQRSSSTLGEMLSILEVKKEDTSDNLTISKEGCSEDSTRSLARSKSVPVSSSVYETIGLRNAVPEPVISNSNVPKEIVAKPKNGMSSFKVKISSLFMSRNKKTIEKSIASQSLASEHSEASGKINDPSSESFHHRRSHSEENIIVNSPEKSSLNGPKKGTSILKASLSLEKSYSSENQDQPSPISVLEAPFEEYPNNNISHPSTSAICDHPQALSRSPPIGSISRTLTRENPLETPLPNSLKPSRFLSRECEEQERFLLVQKLLSHANLSTNKDSSTVLSKWHSLDSPLDPILLDEFLDRKEEAAKCREKRSKQRLLFDCVNAALLSIGQNAFLEIYPWALATKYRGAHLLVTEEVWKLVKDWFSNEESIVPSESEDRKSTVEKLVKGEIAGIGWESFFSFEMDEFCREIGEKLLEDLIQEALADLTDGCL